MYQKVARLARITVSHRQKLLKSTLSALGASTLGAVGMMAMEREVKAQEDDRPNIVFLVADDMGYSDTGAFGGEVDTPIMDMMASEGLMLTNFHTGPNCSPSRSMLLTGVDNHRAGFGQMLEKLAPTQEGQPGYEGYINEETLSVSELLQSEGYNTYWVGKWHLGGAERDENGNPVGRSPFELGFDRGFGILEGGGDHYSNRPFSPVATPTQFVRDGEPTEVPEGFYSTKNFTDSMIEFIDDDRDSGEPFFAFMAYMAPHVPFQVPDEALIRKYEPIYMQGWDVIRAQRFEQQQALGIIPDYLELPERNENVPAWDSLSPEDQRYQARKMAIYAAMIEYLDRDMGRFMDYLKEIGEYDNTIFVLLTDNGADGHDRASYPDFQAWFPSLGIDNSYEAMGRPESYLTRGIEWAQVSTTPHFGEKATVADGGIRGSAAVYAPGLMDEGMVSNTFTSVMDVVPTVLDYADIDHPDTQFEGRRIHPVDGRSMIPLMTGEADYLYAPDEPIGWELGGDMNDALYLGDWKIVRTAPSEWGDGTWKLYNLAIDPREIVDMSSIYPELCNRMVGYYREYLTSFNYVAAKPPVATLENLGTCASNP